MRRLVNLFRRRRLDVELDSELRYHLESIEAEYIANGLSPVAARLAAKRDFGGIVRVAEIYREQRGIPWLEALWRETRIAVRSLNRTRGLSLVVVATLALGIGVNTAVFSVIYSVILKPLPYPAADRMMWVTEFDERLKMETISKESEEQWSKGAQSFEAIAGLGELADNPLNPVRRVFTSAPLNRTFGVRLALGRDLDPEDLKEGAPPVAVVSQRFFREELDSNPAALGHTVGFGLPNIVIGVLPPEFQMLWPAGPLTPTDRYVVLNNPPGQRFWSGLVARLKPGVDPRTAVAELATMRSNPQREPRMVSMQDYLVGDTRKPLLILWGAVGFVLLVACLNVANLLLARSSARVRETAIRAALGAGRAAVIRLELLESGFLALAGGALGLVLAWGLLHALLPSVVVDIPRLKDSTLNWNVLLASLSICVVVGLLAGVTPALAALRTDILHLLRRGERGSSKSRSVYRDSMVVGQLAIALVLLSGAGLMAKSLWIMNGAANQPEMVLTGVFPYTPSPAVESVASRDKAVRETVVRIQAIPGVRSVGITTELSMASVRRIAGFEPGTGSSVVELATVTRNYFEATGRNLLAGRMPAEGRTPNELVVSESFLRRFAPSIPVTREGAATVLGHDVSTNAVVSNVIVGIVQDIRTWANREPFPQIIQAYNPKSFVGTRRLYVRTIGDPQKLRAAIQQAVMETPEQRLAQLQTLEELMSASIASRSFQGVLLASFAGLALLLAMLGTYSVLNYSVAERTREIGVRMALGGTRWDVMKTVLARGTKLALAGITLGLLGALGLARLMTTMLVGVAPNDPWTLIIVCITLLLVAMFAAYIPARRATSVDPVEALRHE